MITGMDSQHAIAVIVAQHPRIAAAWVFGSVARGDARPDSDLDLAVLLHGGERDGDVRDLYALSAEVERYSPSGLVDIVILGGQGSVFRHRVLKAGVQAQARLLTDSTTGSP